MQTTRLAESFETFTESAAHTAPEKFHCKATCDPAVFYEPLELTRLRKCWTPWNGTGAAKGQKKVASRWSEPGLNIFNINTACLCLSLAQTLKKRIELPVWSSWFWWMWLRSSPLSWLWFQLWLLFVFTVMFSIVLVCRKLNGKWITSGTQN